jgi:hypothetical protein
VPRVAGPGDSGGSEVETAVDLAGEPSELLLFVYGRDNHADVTVTGDPGDIEAVRAAV